ncbi:hypothetical protein ZEAMMB73_Zm00001d036721 [Zea mays]|uniref:Uncharacterized protein n=1 Tax=Zea mays TaxID=4577 RepID=A0A1D6LQL0_MAIZE|nr:hypothetical protein ZEAMMB73_Zm00001d036721 [Zea mays]AQK81775.1 hypothetical protein ZEAMMB73_Zm00001d036721 [Zea mays]
MELASAMTALCPLPCRSYGSPSPCQARPPSVPSPSSPQPLSLAALALFSPSPSRARPCPKFSRQPLCVFHGRHPPHLL